jgi:hypothetical protein
MDSLLVRLYSGCSSGFIGSGPEFAAGSDAFVGADADADAGTRVTELDLSYLFKCP